MEGRGWARGNGSMGWEEDVSSAGQQSKRTHAVAYILGENRQRKDFVYPGFSPIEAHREVSPERKGQAREKGTCLDC